MAEKNGTTIVLLSGDMDKVFAAFTLASSAAAAGMNTTIFFTFWGLKAIQKGNLTGKSFMGRMVGLMNRGGLERHLDAGPDVQDRVVVGRRLAGYLLDSRVGGDGHQLHRMADAELARGHQVHHPRRERRDIVEAATPAHGETGDLGDALQRQPAGLAQMADD